MTAATGGLLWGAIVGVAVANLVSGRLGLMLAVPPGYATAVFPPSGIALGALLCFGRRVWPGIALGSALFNASLALDGEPTLTGLLLVPTAIAASSTIQAVLGAWMVRRFAGDAEGVALAEEGAVGRFMILGGPIACLVAPTVGTGVLSLASVLEPDALVRSWVTWWIGDTLGVLIFAPAMLLLFGHPKGLWRSRRAVVGPPLIVAFIASTILFFVAAGASVRAADAELERRADALAFGLHEELSLNLRAVGALASFMEAAPDADPRPFSQSLARRHTAVVQFAAVEPGPDGMRVTFAEPAAGALRPGARLPADVARALGLSDGRRASERALGAVGSGRLAAMAVARGADGRPEGLAVGIFDAARSLSAVRDIADRQGVQFSLRDGSGELALGRDDLGEAPTRERGIRVAGGLWRSRIALVSPIDFWNRWASWLVLSLTALFTALLTGFLLVVTGQAERVRAHRASLAQSNDALLRSNEELQQYAYAASHDLRSPLRTIGGFVQRLEQRYGPQLDERARGYIAQTVEGVHRMNMLIDGLLELSRVEGSARRLQRVELKTIVDEVLRSLSEVVEEERADIHLGELPAVQGDPVQLRQLVQNLLINALKYTLEGDPEVRIEGEAAPDGATMVVVTFADRGVGVPEAHRQTIFAVFRRLHADGEVPGSGLGLAVCERVVTRHGGRIWVEPNPGGGSRFRFTLRCAA